MKKILGILGILTLLTVTSAWAQPRFGFPPSAPQSSYSGQTNGLTSFDLDFHGGTPADLTKAIEKAIGKPLNVIIPADDADTQLPFLKMNDVNVSQLFRALEKASIKDVSYVSSTFYGGGNRPQQSYSETTVYYSFETEANPPMDNSIWYFHVSKPSLPIVGAPSPEACQFYQLQPYLQHGTTVDDITTAIQTGWKMAGVAPKPQLYYHKETSLLIAYGKPEDLATIDNVLKALPQFNVEWSTLTDLQRKTRDLQQQVDSLNKKSSTQNQAN
jgi:hypothetical protein